MLKKLIFGLGNSKLSSNIATFSLPAGHSCPFANECLSKSNRFTGKITDGPHCRFRCFDASQECIFPSIRLARWQNFEMLQESDTIDRIGDLINRSLPRNIDIVRPGISGDYYNEKYFLAWVNVALNNPKKTFYGYTKAIPYLIKYKKEIPKNFRLIASFGGTHDHLILKHNLKFSKVVFSEQEAQDLNLPLDHDDSYALTGNKSFALLLHGTQPAGSEAAKAWQYIRVHGQSGYGRNNNKHHFDISEFTVFVQIKENKVVVPSKKKTPFFLKQLNYQVYA